MCRPPADGRHRLLVMFVVNRLGSLDYVLFNPFGFPGGFGVLYLEFPDVRYIAFVQVLHQPFLEVVGLAGIRRESCGLKNL